MSAADQGIVMSLKELWQNDRPQITGKRLEQLVAFAGEGNLADGNTTSKELRELLSAVPSELLGSWIDEALTNKFTNFGFVLQDLVNEIGRRLGFMVEDGLYRGRTGESGHDGLWISPSGQMIVAESKSSTAFRINLSRIASYCAQVAVNRSIAVDRVSVLLIVGREDTDDVEAQVRGSRYAWSVRLLGVDSLYRLLRLKETLNDPAVEQQIRDILFPQEFTRLDRIVDLVFATSEETQEASTEASPPTGGNEPVDPATLRPRADFHAAILPRLEKQLNTPLVKRSRVLWSSPTGEIWTSCQVSSASEDSRGDALYWFGLKRRTSEALAKHPGARCAFGLGSPDRVVLLPYPFVQSYLATSFTSPDESGEVLHWHIRFLQVGTQIFMLTNRDRDRVDVTQQLLA